MGKLRIPDDVMEYFRKTGALGGKARAKKHTREQLSKWASLGGWPKGRPRKPGKTNSKKAGDR